VIGWLVKERSGAGIGARLIAGEAHGNHRSGEIRQKRRCTAGRPGRIVVHGDVPNAGSASRVDGAIAGRGASPVRKRLMEVRDWPSLQQRLVTTGGRLVKHARYYWLLLAEGGLTRRLFGAMVTPHCHLPAATG
jgi:hypothetical protein